MKQTFRTNLFLLIFLVAYTLLSSAIVLAVQTLMPEYSSMVSSGLIYLLLFGGAVAVFFISSKETIAETLGFRLISPLSLLFTFLLPFLLIPCLLLVTYATDFVLGNNTASDLLNTYTTSEIPFWLALVSLALLPAVFEEFLFRGILLRAYRDYPIWVGVVFSSLAFALFHMSLDQLPYVLAAGVVLGLMSAWTESLVPAIWGHLILNAFSVCMAYLPVNVTTEINAFVYRSANSPWIVFGACAILTLPLLVLCMMAMRKDCVKAKARRLARAQKGAYDYVGSEKVTAFPSFGEMWPLYLFFLITIAMIILPEVISF